MTKSFFPQSERNSCGLKKTQKSKKLGKIQVHHSAISHLRVQEHEFDNVERFLLLVVPGGHTLGEQLDVEAQLFPPGRQHQKLGQVCVCWKKVRKN